MSVVNTSVSVSSSELNFVELSALICQHCRRAPSAWRRPCSSTTHPVAQHVLGSATDRARQDLDHQVESGVLAGLSVARQTDKLFAWGASVLYSEDFGRSFHRVVSLPHGRSIVAFCLLPQTLGAESEFAFAHGLAKTRASPYKKRSFYSFYLLFCLFLHSVIKNKNKHVFICFSQKLEVL